MDALVDKKLNAIGTKEALELKGKVITISLKKTLSKTCKLSFVCFIKSHFQKFMTTYCAHFVVCVFFSYGIEGRMSQNFMPSFNTSLFNV